MAVSSSYSHVLVVESTDFFRFDDSAFARKLDRPLIRGVLALGKVCSHSVVVIDVSGQDSLQVCGAKYDDMIQALSPNGSNDALCIWVLPR